jgi:hypothetical protein
MAVTSSIMILWVVLWAVFIYAYQCFGGMYHLHPTFTMEVICYSNMLVTIYKTALCCNVEDHN